MILELTLHKHRQYWQLPPLPFLPVPPFLKGLLEDIVGLWKVTKSLHGPDMPSLQFYNRFLQGLGPYNPCKCKHTAPELA